MLDALLGARLALWIGQGVARPAPGRVMEALASAEIALSDAERSGFELVFDAPRAEALAGVHPIVQERALRAGARVVLTATIGLAPRVLMDGIVETSEFRPAEGEGPAQLAVRGRDLTALMDREEREATHPAQGPGEIALMILARYAAHGILPQVIPPASAERPNPVERAPMQRETDYAYLRRLAERHDRIFTLIPGPAPLTSTAYWGPPGRLGRPQRAITVDMGPETNASGLSFENAASEAAQVEGRVQDRQSGRTVPVRSTAPLRPPLALENALFGPAAGRRLFRAHGAPTAADAMGQAQAQSDATTDVVTATGEIDTALYGAALEPRGLVGLRGAGLDHDGFWYVKDVVHRISRGAWAQSFTLTREGTGTTTPMVPT
ncbi:MAG: hypothetical protein ACQEUZ_02180 [Pseudomonadota bacterium]